MSEPSRSEPSSPPPPLNVDRLIERLLQPSSASSSSRTAPAALVVLAEEEIKQLLLAAREVLMARPMLLELDPPVVIAGDLHGQYPDVLRMFGLCGLPPAQNYLLLGDYVDRGRWGIETICLLFAYLVKYPDNFSLLRGNHECGSITRIYGFYDECKRRFTVKLWKLFIDVFNCLPVAAIVGDKIFCCHGGLSPELTSMDQICALTRPTDVPDSGLLCDILWSDPEDDIDGWAYQEKGVSYTFGRDVVTRFLARHELDLVCRAHQVVEKGYQFFGPDRNLLTIFSAPNYCGEFDNAGAVMCVDAELQCSFRILKPTLAVTPAKPAVRVATTSLWR